MYVRQAGVDGAARALAAGSWMPAEIAVQYRYEYEYEYFCIA